ncbi:hypothetical protein DMENIID0001_083650 [Sergentomyia squamirostris]
MKYSIFICCIYIVILMINAEGFIANSLRLDPWDHESEESANVEIPVKRETRGQQPRTIYELFHSILDAFQVLAGAGDSSRVARNSDFRKM